jgi:putative salt-induced outer membrane protein YdiY
MSCALVLLVRRSAVALALALLPAIAAAQQPPPAAPPPPPEPAWTGSIGAGVAFTSGNADTSTVNASFNVSSRAKARNVFKAEAIYLRGEEDGDLNLNRLSFRTRDELTRQPHAFVFGQVEYLRDTFKNLQYLVAPTAGVGYKVVDTPALAFDFDAGLGVKVEKSPYVESRTDGAATAGQRFLRKLSDSATVTQSIAALWTLDDFGDALYTVKAGVAATVTTRSQIKVEIVDLYKTRPPDDTVQKNDVSVVTAVVYKF